MKSKWVTVLLITSIVLNLVLAGFIIGNRALPSVGSDPTRSYPRWARTLPEERRESLWPLVRQQHQAMRPTLRELRAHQRVLREAILNEPFDRQILSDALAEMRTRHDKMQTVTHAGFVDFVAQLTQAEREQLAKEMAHQKHRFGHPNRGRPLGPPEPRDPNS